MLGDTTNNPWLFVRHPEWQPVIDVDGPMAVETRKRLLDRAAADRMLVQGYHFPFPATGYITRTASGYDLVPAPWQPVHSKASSSTVMRAEPPHVAHPSNDGFTGPSPAMTVDDAPHLKLHPCPRHKVRPGCG